MQDLKVGEEKGAWKKKHTDHNGDTQRNLDPCVLLVYQNDHLTQPTIFFTPTFVFLFPFPLFFPPETWFIFLRVVDNDYPFSSCSDIREARRPIGLLLSSDPYNHPQQTKCCQRPYSRLSGYHGMKICFFRLTY